MNHNTIPQQIIQYLEENGESWSGAMCRAVHDQSGHKEGVIERRAREMSVASKIISVKAQVNGEGPWCVKYRIKPMQNPDNSMHDRPEVALQKLINESQPNLI